MTKIATIEFYANNGDQKISISAEPASDDFSAVITLQTQERELGKIEVDVLNNKITTFASEVPPELVCLATCGLKALAGPIIDCVRKSNSVDEFIDCMKKKGLSIVTDAASCALDCFS